MSTVRFIAEAVNPEHVAKGRKPWATVFDTQNDEVMAQFWGPEYEKRAQDYADALNQCKL